MCIDRNEKFDVDWSEFLSTATDSSNLCVTGELVRTPQSKVATFGKDTAVRSLCQSPELNRVTGTHHGYPWCASGRLMVNVFHRSSVTCSSHDDVEEIRTVEISLVYSFQMRQKPNLSSPEKVGQKLWVKVTALLNTLIFLQGHSQTATWMYNGNCPVLAKTGKPLQRIFSFPFLCCSWFPEIRDMARTIFTQIVGLKTKFPQRLCASRLYENELTLSSLPLLVNVSLVNADHK